MSGGVILVKGFDLGFEVVTLFVVVVEPAVVGVKGDLFFDPFLLEAVELGFYFFVVRCIV